MLLNFFAIALQTLSSLAAAVQDQFHFYYKDCTYYMYLSFLTVWNFLAATVRFCHTCFHHLIFLQKYGLAEYEGMLDIAGSYTTSTVTALEPEGNHIGNQPAPRVMGFVNNVTNNPAHLPISSLAVDLIWKTLDKMVNYEDAIFVDFGCGVGASMMMAMIRRPFKCIIGVELNAQTAKFCSNNVARCTRELAHVVRCKSIVVENMDMINFRLHQDSASNGSASQYPNASNVILFMYEPLWTISKVDANVIYRKVFRNMKASCVAMNSKLFVAYFFAGKYSGDAMPALQEMKAELIHSESYPSLFFGGNEKMYLYQV
jgi:hypothetical protein